MTIILEYCSKLALAILQDNDLSRSQLTSILGYTSKTSVDRIIQEKAGDRALTDFYERVSKKPDLLQKAPSKQLYDRLSEIVGEISCQDWLKLFTVPSQPYSPFTMIDERDQTVSFYEAYKDCRDLSISVHGGLSASFIQDLRRLMEKNDCHCSHYIRHIDSSVNLSSTVRCLFPILFFQNYEGFTYDAGLSGRVCFELPYNCMILKYTGPEGTQVSNICIFTGNNSCRKISISSLGDLDTLFQHTGLTVQPINSNILSQLKNNYASYLLFCERLEQNRDMYQFKNDFGLEQIPSSIVSDALREGDIMSYPDANQHFSEWISIMARRNENINMRRNEFYHVFKESALRKLADTGKMSDHFWGMRPFTVEERIRIFSRVIHHVENDPNYHLYLLDESHSFTEAEITLYGEDYLSIIKPYTAYQPNGEHSEILIRQKDYCNSFKYFYLRELIPQYANNKRYSLRQLKGILSGLKRRLKEESSHR